MSSSDSETVASEIEAEDVPTERPAGVPAEAIWDASRSEWMAGAMDADGVRDGETRSWRADGTLAVIATYRHGVLHGPFRRFHPDGSLARELTCVEGASEGRMTAWAHEQPSPEQLQLCCVPPGAWRLEEDLEHGETIAQRWYNREGVRILPSGKLYPEHPPTVPPEVSFDEGQDRWVKGDGYAGAGEPHGLWRRWSREGVLREVDVKHAGKAHGIRQRFDERGELLEESHWTEGVLDGPCRRRVVPGTYIDDRVVEERGAFARGLAIGPWSVHDAGGAKLREVDLGSGIDDDGLRASPVLGAARDTAAWNTLANELAAAGRLTEALLAAARASAGAASPEPLRGLVALRAPALTATAAEQLATSVVSACEGRIADLANGLARGGDAAILLRAMATNLAGADRAALDFVDAALLCNPNQVGCYITRALVNLHLGRPADARHDAAQLGEHDSETSAFLDAYARVLFPTFAFWPATTDLQTSATEVPSGPDQPLEAIRTCTQKGIARLALIRRALARHPAMTEGLARSSVSSTSAAAAAPEIDWLPPDLTSLLGDTPPELETWTFEEVVLDENDQPGAPTIVTVEERPALAGDLTIPTLMRLARREWNALCWLCWAAGLDRVAVPEALIPPAGFGVAAAVALERTWRCRDRLSTGGLRALTQGVPGFEWEGIEIDALPGALAEIAADEYVEMRAVFYWLCDAGVQSPWQDNLRGD